MSCSSFMAPIFGLVVGVLYIMFVAILDIAQANLHSYFRAVIAALLPWVDVSRDIPEKHGHLRYALRPVLGAIAIMATTATTLFFFGLDSDRIALTTLLAASLLAIGTLASRRKLASFSVQLKWPSRGFEWRIYPIESLVWHLRVGLWGAVFYGFMRFAQEVDL